MRRRRPALCAGFALLSLTAAVTASRAEMPSAATCALASVRPMLTAQLLFGGRRRDGRLVSEAAWRRFLDRRITPRFPAGLTTLKADGQWRGPDGRLLREPSRVVLIVTQETPAAVAALSAIRTEYAAVFDQHATGLVLSRGCASFR